MGRIGGTAGKQPGAASTVPTSAAAAAGDGAHKTLSCGLSCEQTPPPVGEHLLPEASVVDAPLPSGA